MYVSGLTGMFETTAATPNARASYTETAANTPPEEGRLENCNSLSGDAQWIDVKDTSQEPDSLIIIEFNDFTF